MKNVAWKLGLWGVVGVMLTAGPSVLGEQGLQMFGLQAVADGQWSGPYRFEDGGAFVLQEHVYELDIEAGGQFLVRSLESDKKYGPFEFVVGRIIKVGGDTYAITDGAAPAVSKPAPQAEKPLPPVDVKPEPRVVEEVPPPAVSPVPEAAEVLDEPPPVRTVPPVAGPVVKPSTPVSSQDQPASRIQEPSAPVTPVKSVPRVVASVPPASKPAVRPAAAPAPTSAPDSGRPRPSPAPQQATWRLGDGKNRIGVAVTMGEATPYDMGLSDVDLSREMDIKRDLVGLVYERGFLDVRVSLVQSATWNGRLEAWDEFGGYDRFILSAEDGEGWRVNCGVSGNLVTSEGLTLRYTANLQRGTETYDTAYEATRQEVETVMVQVSETNRVPVSVTRPREQSGGQTGTMTETQLSAGLAVEGQLSGWYAYGAAEVLLFQDIGVKPALQLPDGNHELLLEVREAVLLSVGGGYRLSDLNFGLDFGLVGRPGITLAVLYRF